MPFAGQQDDIARPGQRHGRPNRLAAVGNGDTTPTDRAPPSCLRESFRDLPSGDCPKSGSPGRCSPRRSAPFRAAWSCRGCRRTPRRHRSAALPGESRRSSAGRSATHPGMSVIDDGGHPVRRTNVLKTAADRRQLAQDTQHLVAVGAEQQGRRIYGRWVVSVETPRNVAQTSGTVQIQAACRRNASRRSGTGNRRTPATRKS